MDKYIHYQTLNYSIELGQSTIHTCWHTSDKYILTCILSLIVFLEQDFLKTQSFNSGLIKQNDETRSQTFLLFIPKVL